MTHITDSFKVKEDGNKENMMTSILFGLWFYVQFCCKRSPAPPCNCLKILASESMIPHKMKSRSEKHHERLIKPRESFSHNLKEMKATFTKQTMLP